MVSSEDGVDDLRAVIISSVLKGFQILKISRTDGHKQTEDRELQFGLFYPFCDIRSAWLARAGCGPRCGDSSDQNVIFF